MGGWVLFCLFSCCDRNMRAMVSINHDESVFFRRKIKDQSGVFFCTCSRVLLMGR